MLCITRAEGADCDIHIDGKHIMTVRFIEHSCGRAKLGFAAPQSIKITRPMIARTKEETTELIRQLKGDADGNKKI